MSAFQSTVFCLALIAFASAARRDTGAIRAIVAAASQHEPASQAEAAVTPERGVTDHHGTDIALVETDAPSSCTEGLWCCHSGEPVSEPQKKCASTNPSITTGGFCFELLLSASTCTESDF